MYRIAGAFALMSASCCAELLKGFAYAPVPLKIPGYIPGDDFTDWRAEPMWGSKGRGDIAAMSEMGANVVRLYGNDPRISKKAFLDEAHKFGIGTILGLSDYPYMQMAGSCVESNFDCYDQIKAQYTQLIMAGMVNPDDWSAYHPALHTILLSNEIELKFEKYGSKNWVKAMISAFDAVLDAEKQMNLKNPTLRVSVTMSCGLCASCTQGHGDKPAVGQMVEIRNGMMHPEAYGYTPRNDLKTAYEQRFVNSFNTQAPADFVQNVFLPAYTEAFPNTPVFLGEYHSFDAVQSSDMMNIVKLAEDASNPLEGLVFFEYQVRYDKSGTEMLFGAFGLGNQKIGTVHLGDEWLEFPVWCLTQAMDYRANTKAIHPAISAAYGGPGLSPTRLCSTTRAKPQPSVGNVSHVIV